ncbi:MAG TPA: hypothetical protein PKG52_07700 [bacterium]|nr:hypothetical protein [bacterium]HPS30842.1 hypothetical protein [bacterium]
MLFNPAMSDSSFLLDIRRFYHSVFKTEWKIESIRSVSKGFHIKLFDVKNPAEAHFLINESFSLPEKEIEGKSIDLLIGRKVFNTSGNEIGVTTSLSNTPAYMLIEIQLLDGNTAYMPVTDDFISTKNGLITLLKEPVL